MRSTKERTSNKNLPRKQEAPREKAKKPYTPPKLTVHGTVDQITGRATYIGGDQFGGNALY